MRLTGIAALVLTLVASTLPAEAQVARVGSITGTASNAVGQALSHFRVQLRDLSNGELAGTTMSSDTGTFSFTGLTPGIYAVEPVSPAGAVVGSSAAVTVAAGATAAVTVAASAAAQAGAAGAGGGLSTAAIVAIIAAGAGVAAIIAVAATGSPSQ